MDKEQFGEYVGIDTSISEMLEWLQETWSSHNGRPPAELGVPLCQAYGTLVTAMAAMESTWERKYNEASEN